MTKGGVEALEGSNSLFMFVSSVQLSVMHLQIAMLDNYLPKTSWYRLHSFGPSAPPSGETGRAKPLGVSSSWFRCIGLCFAL